MRNILLLLALTVPLMAQEKAEEDKKESKGAKVVRHLQDADFRKFEAAHRRAHSKRGQPQTYVRESKRHNWRKAVGYMIVGGLGYYIGTLEQNKKRGMRAENH